MVFLGVGLLFCLYAGVRQFYPFPPAPEKTHILLSGAGGNPLIAAPLSLCTGLFFIFYYFFGFNTVLFLFLVGGVLLMGYTAYFLPRNLERERIKKRFYVPLAVLGLLWATRVFVAELYVVGGDSMTPMLAPGSWVVVSRHPTGYQVGDLIVFHTKGTPRLYIKRIAGIYLISPSRPLSSLASLFRQMISPPASFFSTIDPDFAGSLPARGNPAEKYYYVLGDNRAVSIDSRVLGLISEREVKGKVIARIW